MKLTKSGRGPGNQSTPAARHGQQQKPSAPMLVVVATGASISYHEIQDSEVAPQQLDVVGWRCLRIKCRIREGCRGRGSPNESFAGRCVVLPEMSSLAMPSSLSLPAFMRHQPRADLAPSAAAFCRGVTTHRPPLQLPLDVQK